jgi:putative transposase
LALTGRLARRERSITVYPIEEDRCRRHSPGADPEHAHNANAYAARFVQSIKDECLDRIIPIGECYFRRAVAESVEHYHLERNHQGLDNWLIMGTPVADEAGRVRRRSRLGGLLNY